MRYSKIKIFFSVVVACLVVFVVVSFCSGILFAIKHVSITQAPPFPEWNQKDINYLEQLTGVKLPSGTVLLAYSNHNERGRHDVNWWIFSEKKILFPCELKNDAPYYERKFLFEEGCQTIGKDNNFFIKGDIKSCSSSHNSYNGKGHDVYIEIKTSKGYYVQIERCRILQRNSPVEAREQKVPNEKMNNLH